MLRLLTAIGILIYMVTSPLNGFGSLLVGGRIQNFEVQENLLKNGKLAIVALDTAGVPQEAVNGTFKFVINGFAHELNFHDGVGVTSQAVESSAFVFFKHQNQQGSVGKLYFVSKGDSGLKIYFINWYYLILIPVLIVLIGYLFKRLMLIAILLLIGLFIFNYSKGLNLENLFDTIVHGLKGLVS